MTEPYEVHLHPPDYPERCFPKHCKHAPQFVMQAKVHLVRHKNRNAIEIDHAVCLACGLPRPCTIGGNILVDLTALIARFGWHPKIGARLLFLRRKWTLLATYLFEAEGWNGRHERVARLIDPNLTMKLRHEPVSEGHVRMGTFSFDPSYLREEGNPP